MVDILKKFSLFLVSLVVVTFVSGFRGSALGTPLEDYSIKFSSIKQDSCISHIERLEDTYNSISGYADYISSEEARIFNETYSSLGVFKITVYCSCEECSGEWGTLLSRPCDGSHRAIEGHTVAVDPTVIPYGTVLLIDGIEYVAEDCGGLVKGNVIDVYVDNCKNSFGLKYSEVFARNK